MNGIVHARAWSTRGLEAQPDFHTFYRLDSHDRLGNPSIEFQVPLGMRPEPKREAFDTHFHNATQRVTLLAGFVDQRLNLVVAGRV